jgi:hypothetical protein
LCGGAVVLACPYLVWWSCRVGLSLPCVLELSCWPVSPLFDGAVMLTCLYLVW